jgi:glycosyltransferase involved in cell wall biosynthesis
LVFLGRKNRDELIGLYQSAYACVIPSQAFENFPYSCLEAMACGNAVIVTDTGGMTEMAEDGVCGIHVRANDPDQLAAAIRRLAEDPAAAMRMGEASRRVVLERYSTEKMTEKALATYERLIQKARYR